MGPFVDRLTRNRSVAVLLALVSVALLIVAAGAAVAPRTDNPHGSFRESCQLCHTAGGWKALKVSPKFNHSKFGFPLTGAHATASCMGCHKSLDFAQSKTQCASCHEDSHRGEMGTDCARCHGARSFADRAPMVRAHQLSRFPLTGSHATVDCETCHRPAAQGQLQFVGTSANCYSCHREEYETAPGHKSGGRSTQCQTCHSPINWRTSPSSFDHAAAGFPLTGNHSTNVRQCDDCHHGSFASMRQDCASCHTTSTPGYNNPGPGAPAHNATYFPASQCVTCHASAAATHNSWQGGTYAHTQMQLTNAHAGRQCEDCHKGNYSTVAYSCFGCHQNSTPGYANATNPAHTPASFPTSNAGCLGCHNTVAWRPASLVHPASFPLANAHAGRQCEDCHRGNYVSLVNDCYGCHQNSTPGYATAVDPPHTPTNFRTDNAGCTSCHNTIAFVPSTFPANHSTTRFAASYTGAHPAQPCTACHNAATWNVLGTGNDCYSCHASAYATATPPHDATNYPQPGCTCHTTTTWVGATAFDHNSVGFPLTGNHSVAARQCADCHAVIGYTRNATDTDCYTCHTTDYNTAVVKHTAPNFPTTTAQCITCHNAANTSHVSWQGGLFANHAGVTTGLALSGSHGGRACSECHTAPSTDLTQYTCAVSCHTSGRFLQHANKSCMGTTFNTARQLETIKACYGCHPRGTTSSPC